MIVQYSNLIGWGKTKLIVQKGTKMQSKYKSIKLGMVEAVFNKLGGVKGAESFLRGDKMILPTNRKINLVEPPRIPFVDGKTFKHLHEINGQKEMEISILQDGHLYLGGEKVVFFMSSRQVGNRSISGHKLYEQLKTQGLKVLNSNVLDFIIRHPEFFPKSWMMDDCGETVYIFFWGTVYKHERSGNLCVECLYWDKEKAEVKKSIQWLDDHWYRNCPSVCLAS